MFLCECIKHEPYWMSSVCTQIQDWREGRQGQGQPVVLIFCLYFLMLLLFLSLLIHLNPQWYKMAIFQLDQFWMLIQCWNITVSSYTCLDTLIYRSGAYVFSKEISTFSALYVRLPLASPASKRKCVNSQPMLAKVSYFKSSNQWKSFYKPRWFWLM